jgi:hypothetical protein
MSEFYEENNIEIFKTKYYILKNKLKNLLDNIYQLDGKIKKSYLTIHNIMDLVLIYHNFYLCHEYSLLLSAEKIIEKMENIDISRTLPENMYMYISALIFCTTHNSLTVYDNIIQNILEFSNYYYIYCQNNSQNIIQIIELEDELSNIDI